MLVAECVPERPPTTILPAIYSMDYSKSAYTVTVPRPDLLGNEHPIPKEITRKVSDRRLDDLSRQVNVVWDVVTAYDLESCTSTDKVFTMRRFERGWQYSVSTTAASLQKIASSREVTEETMDMKLTLMMRTPYVLNKISLNWTRNKPVVFNFEAQQMEQLCTSMYKALQDATDIYYPFHDGHYKLVVMYVEERLMLMYDPFIASTTEMLHMLDALPTIAYRVGKDLSRQGMQFQRHDWNVRLVPTEGMRIPGTLRKQQADMLYKLEGLCPNMTERANASDSGLVICALAQKLLTGESVSELYTYDWLQYRKLLVWLAWYNHSTGRAHHIMDPLFKART
jgi:hypothetical protein